MAARLEKIARVATAVKMYRRSREALASGENLFHGTTPGNARAVVSSGTIKVNTGTHGDGAYFWRGRPLSTYMRYPEYPGLWTNRRGVRMGPTPVDPNPPGTHTNPGLVSDRPFMEISSTPVRLAKGKQTTVSLTPEQRRDAADAIKRHRFRQVDTRLFHRAEADIAVGRADRMHGSDHAVRPSKRDLVRLLQGKVPATRVGMTRKPPRTTGELNNLYGSYDKAVGRAPQVGPDGKYDYV